jgi:hypothetical protein
MNRALRRIVVAAVVTLALCAAAHRAEAHPWARRNIGIGVVLGEPTGLTLDIRPNHWSSFVLDVGFDTFDDDESGYVHLEYQVRLFDLTHTARLSIPFYLGIGIFYSDRDRDFADDGHLGPRVPIGIAFEFRPPVQIFAELAFRWLLVDIDHEDDHDRTDFGGAVGFRLYF